MSERPKAAVLQGRSSWSSSRQPRHWLSWQLSTPSLLGAPLLLLGTWDPPHRPRLWCSMVRKSSAALQRETCLPRTAEARCEQQWEGFSRGSVHKFTTNLAELEKLRELWVRLKCNSVCESIAVPFILGTVESVIPDSFRARDLAFLSLSGSEELLLGVKLCQKKV